VGAYIPNHISGLGLIGGGISIHRIFFDHPRSPKRDPAFPVLMETRAGKVEEGDSSLMLRRDGIEK
jgi:hypothetical protein